MPRGGPRPGSGRPKGSKTKRTRAKISATVDPVDGAITPAMVMQHAMEVHWRARRYDKAAAIAKDLAPYVHSRLSAVEHSMGVETQLLIRKVVVHSDGNAGSNGVAVGEAGSLLPE